MRSSDIKLCFNWIFLCLSIFVLGSCSDSVIRQYTELGKWSQPGDIPTVLSATPGADREAFEASQYTLNGADWKILEKIAPRPIWERIENVRKKYQHRQAEPKEVEKVQEAQANDSEPLKPTPLIVPDDVRITERSDGKLRIVYPLHHFGGSKASASFGDGTQRRQINVTPVNLAPIINVITKQLKDKESCEPLPSENAVVITCELTSREEVLQLMADLDHPGRQVEISARIFEIRSDFDFQFGAKTILDHLASDGQQRLASQFSTKAFLDSLGNPGLGASAFQGSSLRIFQVFGNSGITLDAVFQALADTGLIREVASPRMTVLANNTGTMLAGQEIPINTARFATNTIITEKTTYRPVGVQLYVTPQTIGQDSVKLHVLTIVSSIAGFNPRMSLEGSDSLQNIVNPVFNTREAETTVTVPDGNTLVIGGLRMVRSITRERKIPGLGDLWGLEWLFKSHRSQRQINDLYFFVTPTIISY